jgi:PAS domain S-box-containing protein
VGGESRRTVHKQPPIVVDIDGLEVARVQQALEALGCKWLGWAGDREALYAQAFQSCADAIVTAEASGQIVACNGSAALLFGWSEGEISGRPLEAILPEWAELCERCHSRPATATSMPAHRINAVRKDGTVFPARVSLAAGIGAQQFRLAIIRDASDHVQLERHFEHAQKMEATGVIAASVAHDLNNALTALKAQLYVARHRADPRGALADCDLIVDRCSALLVGLLAFSNEGRRETRVVELRRAASEAIVMAKALLPMNVAVATDFGGDAAWVALDPSQASQAILNLLLNARDALPAGGRITVRVSVRESGGCRLVVEDNGHGMSHATLARALEPFFTTKAPGRGSGLGLTSVRWIIEGGGGAVSIASELGQGTRVALDLPACPPPAPALAIALDYH